MKKTSNILHLAAIAAILSCLALGPLQAQSVWAPTVGGSWDDDTVTGWNGTGIPNAIDQTATVNTNITASSILNLNQNAIVGSLTLGDSTGTSVWTVQDTGAGGNALTFDVSSGSASLINSGGANIISVPLILNDTLGVANSTALTISGIISGSSTGINKSGAGNLILSGAGANTYTGLTVVSEGTLTLQKGAAATTAIAGDLQIDGGSVVLNTNSNQIADTSTITLNSGATGFTVNVDRVDTISALVIHGGTVAVSAGSTTNTGLNTTTTTIDGGALTFGTRSSSTMTNLNVGGSGAVTLSSTNANAAVLNVGNLTITQPGSGSYTPITLSGTSTAETRFAVTGGNVTFVGNATNSNSTIIDSTGAGSGAKNFQMNANTVFDIGNGGAEVDLVINPRINSSGARSLTKNGTGTLLLNGNNVYTGSTVVNAGTLLIAGTTSGGTAYTVNSGGTLGGTGTIGLASNQSVTVLSGGILSASSTDSLAFTLSGTGVLNVSSALSAGTPSMLFNLDAPASTVVSITGGLNIGTAVLNFDDFTFSTTGSFAAGTYTLFGGASTLAGTLGSSLTGTVGGLNSTISLLGNDVILTAVVPEPSTWVLLAFAGTVVLILRHRRVLV